MLLQVAGLKSAARSLERWLFKHLRDTKGLSLIYVLCSAPSMLSSLGFGHGLDHHGCHCPGCHSG